MYAIREMTAQPSVSQPIVPPRFATSTPILDWGYPWSIAWDANCLSATHTTRRVTITAKLMTVVTRATISCNSAFVNGKPTKL